MTDNYSNPDFTVRDIVEGSKAYFDDLFEHLTNGGPAPTRPPLFDGPSRIVAIQFDNFASAQVNIVRAEKQRLAEVVDRWAAEPTPQSGP